MVNGLVALFDDRFAFLGVGLLDRLLDLSDGVFARQHAGKGEEAGLHDGVDATAHAGCFGHIVGVDGVNLQFFGEDLLLNIAVELTEQFILSSAVAHEKTDFFIA